MYVYANYVSVQASFEKFLYVCIFNDNNDCNVSLQNDPRQALQLGQNWLVL